MSYVRKADLLAVVPGTKVEWLQRLTPSCARVRYEDAEGGVHDAFVMYETIVADWALPDTITLNSGGWQTYTTKENINGALRSIFPTPADAPQVYQRNGQWFVAYKQGDKRAECPFKDGCQYHISKQTVTGAMSDDEVEALYALRAKIRAYVKAMPLPLYPNPGDCWYCLMQVQDGPQAGQTLGDATGDTTHLIAHINEGYYPGALVWNALRWAGWANPGFIMATAQQGWGTIQSIQNALRRYLYRKLGLVS